MSNNASKRDEPRDGGLSVAGRLTAGFGFLMLLVIAMASSGGWALHGMGQRMNQIVDVNDARTGLANDLLDAINRMAIQARTISLLTDISAIDKERKGFEASLARHEAVQKQLIAALSADAADDPGRQLMADIVAASAQTLPDIQKAVRQGVEGDNVEATSTLTSVVRPAEAAWRQKVGEFLSLQKARTADAVANARASRSQAFVLGAVLLGVALLSGSAVAWWTVRNNLRMMAVIARQNADLELRVAQRTAELTQKTNDMAAMLQNMTLGVCTVVPGNRLHPEYSGHLADITGLAEMAHQPVMPTIFGASSLSEDARNQIEVVLASVLGEESMMFDFNQHLLPTEMQLHHAGDRTLTTQLQWSPILGATGSVEKVLLILQDVTHLRALQLEATRQREDLDTIARILQVPVGKFNAFIASSRQLCADSAAALATDAALGDAVVARLFRNMHTVKGNARTFGFDAIANAAHRAEQSYERLRVDPASIDPAQVHSELATVCQTVEAHARINDDTLGRKGRASDFASGRGAFVASGDLVELQGAIHALLGESNGQPAERLRSLVDGLGLAPLQRIASGAVDAAAALAAELGKPTPDMQLSGGEIGFTPSFADALKNSLIHIVRNALDHGIEPPEQRVAAGKPAAGRITLHCTRQGRGAQLWIRDDGRGLALARLQDKAREGGLFEGEGAPSLQALAELIFSPGVSTAASVTQVSGRGVGMDAVRSFLAEQGAQIELRLDDAPQQDGFAPFGLLIRIPPSACRLAAAAQSAEPALDAVELAA